jgi:two-component system, OmpR family, sensor histidine kinase KdpD
VEYNFFDIKQLMKKRLSLGRLHGWKGYILAIGLVILANLLGFLVKGWFAPENIIMFFLLCVTVAAVFAGLGPSILVSILGVLSFDFFFVPPHFTFAVADTQYFFTFAALLLVGFIVSYLTSGLNEQTEAAQNREKEMAALYTLGRDFAISSDLQSYIQATAKRVKETMGWDVTVLLPLAKNREDLNVYLSTISSVLSADEIIAANWAYIHKKITGCRTSLFPNVEMMFIPLVTARGAVGVMAVRGGEQPLQSTPEKDRLLGAYADLAASAIEGIQLVEALQKSQVLKATEKLQTALLNAISHDLRTPLVSVIGVLSSLQEEIDLDSAARKNLIQVAREEADRLNHLIANLLDESRIEAGAISLSLQQSEVEDLIGSALEQIGSRSGSHKIGIGISPELPFIVVDFGLIVQALVNVINNALNYSPADAPIDITANLVADDVQIEIADRGIGIQTRDLPHVFDKFYRIQHPDTVSGTGLGLSISKGIVEAHGGKIIAENRPGGGTIIRIGLPVNAGKTKVAGE